MMMRILRAAARLWPVPVVLGIWEFAARAAGNLSFPLRRRSPVACTGCGSPVLPSGCGSATRR